MQNAVQLQQQKQGVYASVQPLYDTNNDDIQGDCNIHSITQPQHLLITLLYRCIIREQWIFMFHGKIIQILIAMTIIITLIHHRYSQQAAISHHPAVPALLQILIMHNTLLRASKITPTSQKSAAYIQDYSCCC